MYNVSSKTMVNTKEKVEDVISYPIRAIPFRGLKKETCEHFGVRVALSEKNGTDIDAVYFPIYNKKKELCGYQKRDFTKHKDDDWHFTFIGKVSTDCLLFGQNVAPSGGKKSFTHEGPFDAMASWQVLTEKNVGLNPACVAVISTSWAGKQVANNLDFYSNFQSNVFALDNDSATPAELKNGIKRGAEALRDVSTVLPNILVATFAEKDANDMLKEGKNEDLYWALMSKAKIYVPEEVTLGGDIALDQLLTPLEEGKKVHCFPKLMSKLHGLRIPEMTIILAPTKSGKTTICREIGFDLVKSGEFVGHLFLEETVEKTQQSYIALDNNVLLPRFREDPTVISREAAQKSYNDLIDNGRTIYLKAHKITPSSVLRDMRYMAAMGAKYIILDHLSYVFSGDANADERKAIDLLLTELAAFKKEANIHLIVVAHIKRKDFIPKKDKNGDTIYPYWKPVSKEDGRGSGAFEQLCDNLIVIEPETTEAGERGRIRLKVEANREWDDTGIADVVIMDRNTGRLVNAESFTDF